MVDKGAKIEHARDYRVDVRTPRTNPNINLAQFDRVRMARDGISVIANRSALDGRDHERD